MNQYQRIVAFHLKGLKPSDIARECDTTVEIVYSSISKYRKQTGDIRPYPSQKGTANNVYEGKLWDVEESARRTEIARRAAKGAREALEAFYG